IENMAGFVCPSCGEEMRMFSGMTGPEQAAELGIPDLGSIPLDPSIGLAADKGLPSLVANPESPQAAAFKAVAGALAAQLSIAAEKKETVGTEPAAS
ncbi:MAG: P-loop NTPase, partial [Armatimonadetes bacterium]|nr:P-loop NTPase [Armatimonadota bacterium]